MSSGEIHVVELSRALRRKASTFVGIWRHEGPGAAFTTGIASARNSARFWSTRLTDGRRPAPGAPTSVAVTVADARPLAPELAGGIRLSVVVRVGEVAPAAVRTSFESVLAQTHEEWEICACAHATDREIERILAGYRGSDPRMRILPSGSATGPAEATNLAAQQASGRFLLLLDAGDELRPEALREVAAALSERPETDVAYGDEGAIAGGAHCEQSVGKPDWSPAYLESWMYVGTGVIVRKAFFWSLGGLRPRFDGAHDYDLLLRASRTTAAIVHVSSQLYRRSERPKEGPVGPTVAPAREALEDYAAGLPMPAVVEDGLAPGTFRLRRCLPAGVGVTLVILTADLVVTLDDGEPVRLVGAMLRSLQETLPDTARVLVVDDGVLSDESAGALTALGGRRVTFTDPLRSTLGFSFARKANFAARQAETDFVILLNDDLEALGPGWVEALLEPLMDPGVGVTGGRLLYTDGTLQHCGIVLGGRCVSAHAFRHLLADQVGEGMSTHVVREYPAVTGAAIAFRRQTFEAMGGLEEVFAHDYQDVDFCMRVLAQGLRVVYTPYCELVHHEGKSFVRGARFAEEEGLFVRRWASFLAHQSRRHP